MCLIKGKNFAGLQAGFVSCTSTCTVFIWHSLVCFKFSGLAISYVFVYGVSSHIFSAFKCLEFLYGWIILLNILWLLSTAKALEIGIFSCTMWPVHIKNSTSEYVSVFFLLLLLTDSRALCFPAAQDDSKHNVIKY